MSSAPTEGMLTAVADDAAGERRDDLLGALVTGTIGRLGGRGAEMRGDNHLGVGEQRVLGHRLRREHVQRSAADLARVERVSQRRFVDQPAARDVEDAHAVAHLRERLGIQPVLRLRGLRQMDRDEVRLRVDLLAVLGLLDPELAIAISR